MKFFSRILQSSCPATKEQEAEKRVREGRVDCCNSGEDDDDDDDDAVTGGCVWIASTCCWTRPACKNDEGRKSH